MAAGTITCFAAALHAGPHNVPRTHRAIQHPIALVKSTAPGLYSEIQVVWNRNHSMVDSSDETRSDTHTQRTPSVYESCAKNSLEWADKARELYRVARLAIEANAADVQSLGAALTQHRRWDQPPRIFSVALFLAALAIENLLKAHLIKKIQYVLPKTASRGRLSNPTT